MDDPYEWPMINEKLADLLGVGPNTPQMHKKNHPNEFVYGEDWENRNAAGFFNARLHWFKSAAIKVAFHVQSTKAKCFLEQVGAVPLATYDVSGVPDLGRN